MNAYGRGRAIDGVRAVQACLRAGVEVMLMSGRRRAQVFEDARLLGQRSFIFEAGACGVGLAMACGFLLGLPAARLKGHGAGPLAPVASNRESGIVASRSVIAPQLPGQRSIVS